MQPQSSQQLLDSYTRELILLAGKDGVGKSCAIVSMASFVAITAPTATFHVIDSEGKFASALKSYGEDAPRNIAYWPVADMNQATGALRGVLAARKPGDWLAVESMARLWERAQNLGYEAITGVSKIEYIEAKLNTEFKGKFGNAVKKDSPIPRPDDFWPVVKGAHDAAFLDLITGTPDLNCLLTTTVKAPPKAREGQRDFDSKNRKILRAELGIDMNLDGAPRLPYYFETLAMLEYASGSVSCHVLRDNNSKHEVTRPTFAVEDRKAFAMQFMATCR